MEKELENLFIEAAAAVGVDLTDREVALFGIYLEELKEWNARINLTAIRDDRGIVFKHFVDSMTLSAHLNPGGRLYDIGSGAGFPGIPLKIVDPTLEVHLVESSDKKAAFLKQMVRRLGKHGLSVHPQRAESLAGDPKHQGKADYLVTRGVGGIPALLEKIKTILKPGGRFIAMLGKKDQPVPALIKGGAEATGFAVERSRSFSLPVIDEERTILILERRT